MGFGDGFFQFVFWGEWGQYGVFIVHIQDISNCKIYSTLQV